MNIKEIANKYTRKEFMDMIDESVLKDTSIEIETENIMCPGEVNGLDEFCELGCEFCWKRSIKDVKFKDEQENKSKGEDNMSKEYSFKEVIVRIKPGEKYVCTDGALICKSIELTAEGDYKIIHANESNTLCINRARFVKEKKSVDFIDAMKAYQNGHTIYCEWSDHTVKYTPPEYPGNYIKSRSCIVSESKLPMCAGEILEGKWYIE